MSDQALRAAARAATADPGDHAAAVREWNHRLRVDPPCEACDGVGSLADVTASGGTCAVVTMTQARLQCAACAGENGLGTGQQLRGRLELAAWCGDRVAKDVLGWEYGTPYLVRDGSLIDLPFDSWVAALIGWSYEVRARAAHAAGVAALEGAPPEEQDDGPQAPDSPARLALDACLTWIEKRGSWREWFDLTHDAAAWPLSFVPCAEIVLPPPGARERPRDPCTAGPSIRAAARATTEDHIRAAISRSLIAWALRP